jgi:chaperonin GroEL
MLDDIAVLTRGRCLTEDLGIKLEDLGKAKWITIDKENTTIVEGEGSTKDIQGRIDGVFLKLVSAEELDEVRRRLQIPLNTHWFNLYSRSPNLVHV